MDDDNFIEAVKLNVLGIALIYSAGGIIIGALLTAFFKDPILAVGIGIILATSGVVVYAVGVSKR